MSARLLEPPALLAIMAGFNEKALALLHNDHSPGAVYMRGRALFRLGHFSRAIEEIERENVAALVPEEVASLLPLHVFALARIGKLTEANSRLREYEDLSPVGFGDAAHLEFQYAAAYLNYCGGRYDECCAALEHIIARTSSVSADLRRFAFQQDFYAIRAKAATLLGVIFGSKDQFNQMERWHCEALLSAERSRPRDSFLEAVILANLSCAVGEVYCPSAVLVLRDRQASLSWTPSLDESRLYIRRNLRLANNVFGEKRAIDGLEASSSPSLAWRLAESVDKLITESWPSRGAYIEELYFAKSFIDRIDWAATSGEESAELHQLALVLAPFDVTSAIDANTRLDLKLKVAWPHFPAGKTARDKALFHFAKAGIAKATAQWPLAESEYQEAIQGLLSSGIVWRSSIAAVELFAITRDTRLLEIPRQFISDHPATVFSRKLERAVEFALRSNQYAFPYFDLATTK